MGSGGTVNIGRSPRQTYKAMLFDYDELLLKSDDECCYSLSEREVQLILAQLDYITWKTRYRPTSTEIEQEVIDQWNGNLARKLMSGCCPDNDQLHRYLHDGTYQTSTDGGETWFDEPAADPRYSAPLAPPLSGGDGDAKRCAAADNVRQQYEEMRNGTIELLTDGTTALLIVSFLVGLLGGILSISVVGVSFGVMLFSLAGYLLSLTPESVSEQLDSSVMDEFRCLVYCRLGDDGRMTDGAFAALLADIATTFNDFTETFFYSITASLGATGISNASTMGTATADNCADCECPNVCIDQSNIMFGSFVEKTPISITINSEFTTYLGTPTNWAVYGSDTDDFCCYYCSFEVLSGSGVGGDIIDCNGDGPVNSPGFRRRAQFAASAPFQIRFVFDPQGDGCG